MQTEPISKITNEKKDKAYVSQRPAQMVVLSCSFSVFVVPGIYNFGKDFTYYTQYSVKILTNFSRIFSYSLITKGCFNF